MGKKTSFNARKKKNFAKERITEIKVYEPASLFEFIQTKVGSTRNTTKTYLQKRMVSVNNIIETKFDRQLKKGDVVKINFTGGRFTFSHPKISIIYEDEDILVVNKKEGILSVPAPGHDSELTVLKIMVGYVKSQNRANELHTVHRIDRDTSGVLMFARRKEVQQAIKLHWHDDDHRKIYYALVEGIIENDEGVIESYLTEDLKNFMIRSCPYDNGGMYAKTSYKVIKRGNGKTLVKCELTTGRKNQIRVHLQSIGHPIVGDIKYGASENSKIKRLCLHATYLAVRHPIKGEIISFETPVPRLFFNVVNERNE